MAKQKSRRKTPRQHDPVYRRIFNRARIIEEILRRFATGPWASKLDFSTLEQVPADFVTLQLDRRESDIIWRVRHGEGDDDWFFVFILMELQSRVSRFMALRLWGYLQHLAQAVLDSKAFLASHRPRLLPPILPVVLYNGEAPWTAPRSLAELFMPMEGYEPPDFRYVVLDVNRYSPEELRPIRDVTSGVFLMEQAASLTELQAVIAEFERLIDDRGLEEDVALLVRDVALQLDVADEEVPPLRTLREVKMSLLQRAEKWTQEWFAEGEAEGLIRGRAEGRAKGQAKGEARGLRLGKAEALKTLVRLRFGELPASAVDRIDCADIEALDRWLGRILTATRLEDVFGAE